MELKGIVGSHEHCQEAVGPDNYSSQACNEIEELSEKYVNVDCVSHLSANIKIHQ